MSVNKLLIKAERILDSYLKENFTVVFGAELSKIQNIYPNGYEFRVNDGKPIFKEKFNGCDTLSHNFGGYLFCTPDMQKCILSVLYSKRASDPYDCFACISSPQEISLFIRTLPLDGKNIPLIVAGDPDHIQLLINTSGPSVHFDTKTPLDI